MSGNLPQYGTYPPQYVPGLGKGVPIYVMPGQNPDITTSIIDFFVGKNSGEGTYSVLLGDTPRGVEACGFLSVSNHERALSDSRLQTRSPRQYVERDRSLSGDRLSSGRSVSPKSPRSPRPRSTDLDRFVFRQRSSFC
jgi:hypothetical protein